MPETYEWVDADGEVFDLDTDGARVLQGVDGRFMPPVELLEQEIPLQPGAILRNVKTKVREVTLPIVFTAPDEVELRQRIRAWAVRFDPNRGDGALRVRNADGYRRELPCRYSDGLSLTEDGDTAGPTFQKAVLVFRSHTVYWTDGEDHEATFTTEVDEPVPFFPFFPIRLLPSELFKSVMVRNVGDAPAWPVWTITGPADSPLLIRNDTTGKKIEINRALATAETVTIDTRPRVKSVTDNTGANLYSLLTVDSALFELAAGENIVLAALGGTTLDTEVLLSYRNRYFTA